ncbi:MAG: chromate resistance protein [Candidatus Rokubacteria bacterium]|nr:chromate resistance protein [Candidatus Rokubacteria bacterium]MBI3826657.1 chromate resistance protein [Candidatus Rokubacteria bacterium]
MRWLTLLLSLPPTPTRHRVGVWRKLQRMGAVKLRGAAWLLPDTPETAERFQWLVQEVQTFRGEATLLRVDRIETMSDEQVGDLFHRARAADYQAVLQGVRDAGAQIDRLKSAHRGVPAAIRARLDALKRELDRIDAIDYLRSPLGERARAAWEAAARRLRALESRPRAARGARGGHEALPPAGSTWVTRPRPHIDRIASAWLVKRFFDPAAKFAFADAADAARKGIPFDILGVEFGHHGEDCTFETLVKRFGIKDRRIKALAEIVHEADLADGKFTRTEAPGVDLTLKGLATGIQDDQELLERGMAIFDGLYTALRGRA